MISDLRIIKVIIITVPPAVPLGKASSAYPSGLFGHPDWDAAWIIT